MSANQQALSALAKWILIGISGAALTAFVLFQIVVFVMSVSGRGHAL
jgi:hypothetical protein